MQLLETTLRYNNQVRYYIDGHRVSKARFEEVKATHDLDTFQKVTNDLFVRDYCCARPRRRTG